MRRLVPLALWMAGGACVRSGGTTPMEAGMQLVDGAGAQDGGGEAGAGPSDVARDLAAIVGPRHHSAAPAHLRAVGDLVASRLGALGFAVSRRPVQHAGSSADIILGERLGSGGDRVVIVDAHYDAVAGSAGADDNASAVAGLLEVARTVAPVATRHTVRLIAFPFEEEGLVGSRAYVQALTPAERARIAAVFNFEMIGYRTAAPGSQRYPAGLDLLFPGRVFPTTGDFIAAFAVADQAAPLTALDAARAGFPGLKVELLSLPRPVAVNFGDFRRSDHAPFWDANVPAVFIGDTAEYRNPNYHRPTDTLETIDVGFVTLVARWASAAALAVAERR